MPQCTSIRISLGNVRKQGIVIKLVPGNHQALHAFCQEAQKTGHKLFYAGESAGVVAYRYMLMLTVRKRETIPEDTATALMELQDRRCGACGDLLRKIEKHHKKSNFPRVGQTTSTIWFCCAQPAMLRKLKSKNKQPAAITCGSSPTCLRECNVFRDSTTTHTNPLGRRDSAAQRRLLPCEMPRYRGVS